jgi:hypothetical protein
MVYPKIIDIIIFINVEAITKLLKGLMIKIIIKSIENEEHKHTCLVTFVKILLL